MMELVGEYWLLLLIALLIGIAIAWFIFHSARKTRVTGTRHDPLDEGAERTKRNQALIDAPSASMTDVQMDVDNEPYSAAPMPPVSFTPETREADISTDVADQTSTPVQGDDLSRIKGLGPKLVTRLRELGVTTYAQIATWDDADIARIDAQLGRFEGRIERDDWVTQAKLLMIGNEAEYEAKFGKTS